MSALLTIDPRNISVTRLSVADGMLDGSFGWSEEEAGGKPIFLIRSRHAAMLAPAARYGIRPTIDRV